MIDVTVKTLDSQNHKYSVPEEITVRQFKDRVATSVGIPADKQRLIYCGRVLQDDKKLSEYDVNGKVIHLVQRPPPPSATRPSTSTGSSSAQPAAGSGPAGSAQANAPGFAHRLGGAQDANSFLLGAFTIPSDVMDPNQVQQIVHQVVSGMGEFGRNATIMSRTSDDGSTVDVHINLGQVPLVGESRQRIGSARNMIRRANACLNRLEIPNGSNRTSPTTEEASSEEPGAVAAASSETATAEADVEEAPVEGFVDGLAVAGIIEGELFLRPAMAMPGTAGGVFPAIADAARLAANTALAAAATSPMTEIPQPQVAPASIASQSSENVAGAGPRLTESNGGSRTGESVNGAATPQADGQQQRANGQAQQQQRVAQPTHAPVLGTLMEELATLQSRLQPYLTQYQTMMQEDRDLQGNAEERTRHQRTFNLVSEAVHFISHAYHAVSDIMVDMAQTPPRTLRSRSIVVQQPTLVQAGIPMQAQINIGSLNAAAAMHAAAVAAANQASGNAASATANSSAAPEETPSGTAAAAPIATPAPAGGDAAPSADSEQQQHHHQHPNNIPLGIGIPAQMASFFQSPNPVVFMEVGPGSITASVVSETIAGQPVQLAGPRFPDAAFPQVLPPQDLIRNLMQAVGQQATTVRNGNNGQSQARGNTATQPTTSTQTRSTSRPIQTIPIAFPGMGHSNFDPYLPCSSHHLRRPVIPIRNLAQQQQGHGTANAPTDTQLAGIIANLMSALFSNHATVPGTSGAANTTGVNAPTTSAVGGPSSSSNATAGAAGRGGMQQLGRVRRMLGELLSLRRNVNDTSQTSTIADFLQTLPDYSYQEGEGLISDLVMTMARRLSLRELVELLFGRSEILNRLRSHLQQFVRGRVLNDAAPTSENVQAAVGRLAGSMVDVLRLSVQDIEIREGVNYFATLRTFLEEHLLTVIRIILSTREEEFGSTLYAACRQIISEEVLLNVYCFRNGQRALERMVQNTVRQIAVDLDPFILQWMQQMCTVQIRAMIPNITVREVDIMHYVVRESAMPPAPAQPVQAASAKAPAPATMSSESPDNRAAPMESTTLTPEFATVDRKSKKAPVVVPTAAPSAPSEEEMDDAPNAVPMDTSEPNLPPGGGAWQGAVPLDWVPIISEDVQRQRRQSVQRPFSDAYVATMPSKRRKMMNGDKLGRVDTLSDTLKSAIGAVGCAPTTSLDAVLSDVATNTALNSAFQEHLSNSVSNRLNADKDFSPQKFPNADIVFRCQRPDGEP